MVLQNMALPNRLPRLAFIVLLACLPACLLATAGARAADQPALVPETQLFTKANLAALCSNGQVDREALAERIVQLVNLSLDVKKRATGTGQNAGSNMTNAEHYVYDLTPFGENGPPGDKAIEDAKLLQTDIRTQFQTWALLNIQELNPDFRIEPRIAPVPFLNTYYKSPGSIEIKCGAKTDPSATAAAGTGGFKLSDIPSNLVVRKSVKDIAVPKTKLAKANAALFSYSGDLENDVHSYAIDGLVGYTIAGTGEDRAARLEYATKNGESLPLYWFSVTPYVYHKRFGRSPTSASKPDINLWQPGIAGTLTWVSPEGRFAFDLIGEGSWTGDQAQASSVFNGSISFSPSLQVGDTILFNAPLFFGPVALRPNLSLEAREFVIEDVGTNPSLVGKHSFATYGYDAELKMYLVQGGTFLQSIEGRIAYSERLNTGSVPDIHRIEAGLSFQPFGVETVTMELNYVDGRSLLTFQEEESWIANLGVRF